MWIEIYARSRAASASTESSPAGDVDWNMEIIKLLVVIHRVISCGRCGLKWWYLQAAAGRGNESSPAGDVDWNGKPIGVVKSKVELSPAGDVDWNHMENHTNVNQSVKKTSHKHFDLHKKGPSDHHIRRSFFYPISFFYLITKIIKCCKIPFLIIVKIITVYGIFSRSLLFAFFNRFSGI